MLRACANAAIAPAPSGAEAADFVIAGVHLEDQRGFRPDGRREIAQMGAVGGADLAQLACRPAP
jgi:hypothetical protein